MRFLKIILVVLVLSFIFVFFVGWQLFDFSRNVYLTTAVWSVIISVLVYVLIAQDEKIERLEKRIKELEDQILSEQ